jgi:hypothetical protein
LGEPQIVTKHGEEVAVVIDIAEYRRLRGESMTFMEYLRADPSADEDFEIERGIVGHARNASPSPHGPTWKPSASAP